MTKETPAERLARMMEKRPDILAPKTEDDCSQPQEAAREGLNEAIKAVVDDLRRRLGGGVDLGNIEVHEVRVGPHGITIDGKSTPTKDEDDSDDGDHKGAGGEQIAMAMDLSPLEIVRDERVREHAIEILRSHNDVVKQLADVDADTHPWPQFAVGMGQVVVKAGMAGAMMLAGRDGSDSIRPQDFQGAMVGSVGGVILSALRYGQTHPEALTAADGVPDSALSDAVDKFLAGFGKEDTEDPKEGEE